MLTQSRMAWLNTDAAQWELFELDERSEELQQCDLTDTGNLRTRLVHRPDEGAAKERFAAATQSVMKLIADGDRDRVETRLRSSTELDFLLHGFPFARAHVAASNNSFAASVRVTVGAGENETVLTEENHEELAGFVAQLFARRRALPRSPDYAKRGQTMSRRIGAPSTQPAHSRLSGDAGGVHARGVNPQQDPLFRAAPERWLESVLRNDLAPLTRGLARAGQPGPEVFHKLAVDPDAVGNIAETTTPRHDGATSRAIPRLDPDHVYTQVPAIAGASDRGMLDLLGVTADGRLAVIELKADDDLHLALQGLDYWIRVRHHHLQSADPGTGLGEFQRHGYFVSMQLSPLAPRLYLVAPALHIHPATETILRYLSPRVEWTLLALDERWRQEIRVVWRKSGGKASIMPDHR